MGGAADGWGQLIGGHGGLRKTLERAQRLSQADVSVLLEGETGVGKDLFARAIHDHGTRRGAPFVTLNCGGLSRELLSSELFGYVEATTGTRRTSRAGRIESAHGGTLFLDEISQIPSDLQPYLLRVLEGEELYPPGGGPPRRVNFRLISTCNGALRDQVNAGRFRKDLYYRISVTSLQIPPLRERMEDLPALVEHFAAEACARHGLPLKRFSSAALEALARHAWPGNVRELRNVVESMVLLAAGELVDVANLPADLAVPEEDDLSSTGIRQAFRLDLEGVERDAISAAIRARAGNLTQVARDLRISRSTLYLKLKKHGLDPLLSQARLCH